MAGDPLRAVSGGVRDRSPLLRSVLRFPRRRYGTTDVRQFQNVFHNSRKSESGGEKPYDRRAEHDFVPFDRLPCGIHHRKKQNQKQIGDSSGVHRSDVGEFRSAHQRAERTFKLDGAHQ